MKSINLIILATLTILFMVPHAGLSQEEIFSMGSEYGVNARAMGMGNARIATSDDYSAAFNNPAGLGQLRRMELHGTFSHLKFNNDATFLGNQIDDSKTSTQLNSLGFAFPVPTYRGSLVFSVGFARIKDYESTMKLNGFNPSHSYYKTVLDDIYPWIYVDEDQNFEYIIDTTIDDSVYQDESLITSGGLKAWAFSGAMEVQKDIFIGATVNFWSGSQEHTLMFAEDDRNNRYSKADTTVEADGFTIYDYNDYDGLESTEKSRLILMRSM